MSHVTAYTLSHSVARYRTLIAVARCRRVLTLNTLSHESGTEEGLPLNSDLSIEEAMQEMIVTDHNLVTVMKEGKSIGQVSLNDMVAAIAKPKTSQTGASNAYR